MIPQLLSDLLIYIRRIIKRPNTSEITDDTLLDYLNRFFLYEMPYRVQLFCLQAPYTFETQANIANYTFDVNNYNLVLNPAYVDGTQVRLEQSLNQFNKLFPTRFNNSDVDTGDGTAGPYTFTLASLPVLRGYRGLPTTVDSASGQLTPFVYVTGSDSTTQYVLTDDGQGNLIGDGSGTINYLTGSVSATFSSAITSGNTIRCQSVPYQAGRPQVVLFYGNVFTLRPVPDKAYQIAMSAMLTPSAFLNTQYAENPTYQWMAEYLAYGASRKILQDFADTELLALYEPIFREKEALVIRRTERQASNERTPTIFSAQVSLNPTLLGP